MNLKLLTAEKHNEAENTPFMKAVFSKTLPFSLWIDWTYQKTLFYSTIEMSADNLGLLETLPDIKRSFYIHLDFADMWTDGPRPSYKQSTLDYNDYLLTISNDRNQILAHLYTWHMGDLFGGQMIKKIITAPHRSLNFENSQYLMTNFRNLLSTDLAPEANVAFSWAIKMMREYDHSLE